LHSVKSRSNTAPKRFAYGHDPGPVSAASQNAYQIGKDFAMAIDDSKKMKDNGDSFNYTIVDMVYLIDELEGRRKPSNCKR
jgi:hypothetical protein